MHLAVAYCGAATAVWNRLNGTCHACPNTAWLLFLMFSIALVAIVAMSVYLSRKRLNLSALGIGIVSGAWLCVRVCMRVYEVKSPDCLSQGVCRCRRR